ncbi:hypothetical protein N7319_07615 [Aeromonas dhakensis]|uniref:hypothetical protein n=1 Tax=Aeromonas dhakensis TaxID=196024 RepID=UPI002447D921|nr:hypothetical protein [Aeromonas dhakensis]MDH0175078.1 hypothetical protein [Aeromonas dhakensis]
MNRYLVVEDNDDKASIIINELRELGISSDAIKRVISLRCALTDIKTNKYNIVILDLCIPTYLRSPPVDNGGLTLLQKIISFPAKYIKPNHIIGVTSYEKLAKEQQNDFSDLDFSLKCFDDDSWKRALKNKVLWDLDAQKNKHRVDTERLFISVHGIRTLGHWQNTLEGTLLSNTSDITFKKYRYNYYSALQLLIPSSRSKIIDDFAKKLTEIVCEYPNSKITLIAHSFGTYIAIKALEAIPVDLSLNIERVVLVSSVLKPNYDWSYINMKHNIESINNECGFNDNILILSHFFSHDMGMAGRVGFTGMNIKNRFFKGGHDFFNREKDFMEKYWIPIFTGSYIDIDERKFSWIRENLEICLSSKITILFIFSLIAAITFWLS